ncbi:penicillin-binding protein 2 [Patescibacteria group bacterium]|nr:penicillin-binding protein 2 [Patescibacteria group bacterium]
MSNFFKKIKKNLLANKKNYFIDDEEYQGEGEEEISGSEEILVRVENIRRSYFFWFYLTVILVFIILFTRLWILQVIQGDYNKTLAEGNRIRTRDISASRGIIYDRQKQVLAKNIPDFTLVVYAADLPKKEEEREEYYQKISEMSAIPLLEIRDKIEPKKDKILESVVLKENIPLEEAFILEEKASNIKGLAVEKRSTRGYITGADLGHLLGYVGDINEEEYRASPEYDLNDKIGKAGIEKTYETYLKGADGREQIEVDSSGRLQKIIAKRDPLAGDSLILSLDLKLQKKAREMLEAQLKAQNLKKGVVIVSDPRNGQILAMVSLPDFDNNIFESPTLKDAYPSLINDPNQPLFNRAVAGVYPSGSSIKPVVAAAALEEGVVTVNDWIIDKGFIEVPNQYDPSIIYRFIDWKAHGGVNIIKALAESCNVFFYTVGGGYDRIKGLGVERLDKYFRLFGLGEKTGIDLDGEAKGLVPDPEWKERTKKEPWVLGDTYHLSIGQGDLGVTPLQINNYTAAIANGGTLYKPRLGLAITSSLDEKTTDVPREVLRKDFITSSNLNIVRQGMRACVISGSCDKLNVLPVSSAGKTGTAQSGRAGEPDFGWFTAFAPYENPEVAITVLIENGGEGYVSAEPVAVNILNYFFSSR